MYNYFHIKKNVHWQNRQLFPKNVDCNICPPQKKKKLTQRCNVLSNKTHKQEQLSVQSIHAVAKKPMKSMSSTLYH